MIQRKLDLTLIMSLLMFYEIVHHLLPVATAADLFVQQTMLFVGVFAYCQLTLEHVFVLIYVLQMSFALLFLHLLLSLYTHLINPPLDCRHFMRLNLILTDDDEKEAADGIALLFDDNSCS